MEAFTSEVEVLRAEWASLWGDLSNRYLWLTLLVTLAFGAVGWIDDYRKVVERDSRGLPARWKYLWQSLAGLAAALYLYLAFDSPVTTELYVPLSLIPL